MFLGLLRTVVYIVGVWFIWRWLDGAFLAGGMAAVWRSFSATAFVQKKPDVPTTPRKGSTSTSRKSKIDSASGQGGATSQ